MSQTQRILCDLCGRSFSSYEGDITPLAFKLEGPTIQTGKTPEVKSAAGQVQALSVETSHIDHEQAIEVTDACGECYDALRQFIVNRRKGAKFKAPKAKAAKPKKAFR